MYQDLNSQKIDSEYLEEVRKEAKRRVHFKKGKDLLPFQAGRDCPICLAPYEDDDDIWQLTCSKGHVFHRDCLGDYLDSTRKHECPMCRAAIEDL